MTDLRALLAPVKCVLFDFDGPVCRLHHGHPAKVVAVDMRTWVLAEGYELGSDALSTDNFLDVLRDVGRRYPSAEVVGQLEARLTGHELTAARTAYPTPYADPLIRTLKAVGTSLAITSNNSPDAVTRYLTGRGLASAFGPHVHGRTGEPDKLKPDPDCLLRALASTGAAPEDTLMIGDTPVDFLAAREAGVAFLGYAHTAERWRRLSDVGAEHIVDSLLPVLDAVRTR